MRKLRLEPTEDIEDKRPFFESLRTGEGFHAFSIDDDKIDSMAALFDIEIESLGWSVYRRPFDDDEVVTSIDELDTVHEVGQWVEFDRVITKRKANRECHIVRKFEEGMPWKGRISGITHRKSGLIRSGGYRELPSFEQSGSFLVWEVQRGLKNNPVHVHPDDIRVLKGHDETLPVMQQNKPYADRLADDMSEIMEGWPRDEQGRWLPKD